MKFHLFILLFISIKVNAQIILKQHNFVSIGDSIVEYYNKLPKTYLNIGKPGENKTWDFSGIDTVVVNTKTLQFLDPKETPFFQDYLDANIVLYSNDIYESWVFMNKSNSYLKNLGSGILVNKEKRIANVNSGTLKFPLKYLDESMSNAEIEKVIIKDKEGNDSIKVNTIYNHKRLIDAWGDILLPKGTFLGLRMKYTLEITNSIYQKKGDKWILTKNPKKKTTISYSWWTDDNNAKYPIAQVVMDEAHKKPIDIHYLKPIPFGEIINEDEDKSTTVHPSPAREKISLDLKTTEKRYITIFSIEGKTISNLIFNMSEVTIDIASLPAEVYFLVIRDEGGQIMAKERFIKVN